MPYINERAERLGHVPLVANQAVRDAIAKWTVSHARPEGSERTVADLCTPLEELQSPQRSEAVTLAVAVDGSDMEVEATRDYPSVKAGFLRVSASLVNLALLKASGDGDFVDPRALQQAVGSSAFDHVLPGAGLVLPGMTAVGSWRHELDQFLQSTRFDGPASSTLADLLLTVHGELGAPAESIPLERCPNRPCETRQGLRVGTEDSYCPGCGAQIYLADVLRTHEEYNPVGSNLGPLTRAMNVLERLVIMGCIDTIVQQRPQTLSNAIFITDGPLALHGVVAPLKRRLQAYLASVGTHAEERGHDGVPLVVGVEKGGQFVEHAELMSDLIPEGSVMHLPVSYINRITGREPGNQYGRDEFYGRRFIYRTSTGNTLVITVPPRPGVLPYEGPGSDDLDNYPTLRTVCEVLDRVQTRLYPNAVIPVALAHSAASLPLGVGQSVLRRLLQEGLSIPTSSLPGPQPRGAYPGR